MNHDIAKKMLRSQGEKCLASYGEISSQTDGKMFSAYILHSVTQ